MVYASSDTTTSTLCVRTQILHNCKVIKTGNYEIIGSKIATSAILKTVMDPGEWLLEQLMPGDATLFAFNYGHHKVHEFKSKNYYLKRFLDLLTRIKVKTGCLAKVRGTSFLKGKLLNKFLADTKVRLGIKYIRSEKKTLTWWIKKQLNIDWNKDFRDIKGLRQTKNWVKEPDPKLSNLLINMTRKNLGHALQFLTGHGWWKGHLFKTKLIDNQECWGCCEEFTIETLYHLYYECVGLVSVREEVFGTGWPVSFHMKWEELISFFSIETIVLLTVPIYKKSKVSSADTTQ